MVLLPHPTNPRLLFTGGWDGKATLLDISVEVEKETQEDRQKDRQDAPLRLFSHVNLACEGYGPLSTDVSPGDSIKLLDGCVGGRLRVGFG